ncbi:MAG: ribosomal protein [Actinomycetota bacterium]
MWGHETTEPTVARADKTQTVTEVREHLAASTATILTHYRGLGVGELKALRAALRAVDAELKVVKNTLARRAATDAGMDGLAELLEGPTGIVFCGTDPVGPAKALKAFAKDHPELVIRGGYLDGEVLDEAAATRLADLASREELLARMAGLLVAPLAAMARLLQAPMAGQARAMQALVDKGGANPGAAPAASAPADVPATEAADAPAAEAADEPAAETEAAETEAAETEA